VVASANTLETTRGGKRATAPCIAELAAVMILA